MGDNLAELLYMAWRHSLLSSQPDLPSWGNVRDPDVRAAWEAAATKAREDLDGRFRTDMRAARKVYGAEEALANLLDPVTPFTYGEHNAAGDCDHTPCIACTTRIKQGDTVTDWEEGYKHHPTCPTETPS